MPRNYKPQPNTKRYKKYDSDLIQQAVLELESTPNATLNEISKKFNINKSVLYRHSRRTMKPQGGQTALGREEEEYIIENINKYAEQGYPMDTMDLRYIVKIYLDKLGVTHKKFKNNMPGPDFVQGFLKRHSDKISKTICENIKRVRAEVSPNIIKEYHDELKKSIDGLPPSHIINYDETNLTDDPVCKKSALMTHGAKYPEQEVNDSMVSISIMMAATAEGVLLPPYVVYKSAYIYDTWIQNGPEGVRYNRTASGCFEGSVFEEWVTNIAIPFFDNLPGRKCLIGNNLASHLSVDLIRKCTEHNIDLIFLPPNSTHLTQPLNVAFFKPMKQVWQQILLKWKKTDGRQLSTVPKECIPKLLRILINTIKPNAKSNIIDGFRKTGIYPSNVNEILSRLPQEKPSAEANESLVNDSVLDLLKEMRYGTMNVTESKRKRKLNIVTGKSVSPDETVFNYADTDQKYSKKNSKQNDPQPSTSLLKETGKRKKILKAEISAHEELQEITETKNHKTEEVTFEDESYYILQVKEEEKGKGKGKKTFKHAEIIKDEKESFNITELFKQRDDFHKNLLNNVEVPKQEMKSMPIIFFDDLNGGQDVIITDENNVLDTKLFNEQEFKIKEIDIIEDNTVIEKKT